MKKKTLAYVIGGEARLVAETYKQDEILISIAYTILSLLK